MRFTKSRWVWVTLFIIVVGLIATLATTYNVVMVQDREKLHRLGQQLDSHRLIIILGTTGFAVALFGFILFFVKILREMKLNQLQSEFLASVSHSLKTPITTIELSSSMLKDSASKLSTDEREGLWSSHQAELMRLREQVETLLETARLQSSKPRINLEPIQLEHWLTESWPKWKRILGPQAVLVRQGPKLDRFVMADPKLLSMTIDNLIDNARKFSKDVPHVTIATSSDRSSWEISVTDQGWGFIPKDSKKIFTRFFRSPATAPYAIPGSGLGLHLAQMACKEQKMKLAAESKGKGTGARFTLTGKMTGKIS